MTPKQEQEFIRLWRQGATYRQIAAALECSLSTVTSWAGPFIAQGVIEARSPQQQALARQAGVPADRPPSTVHPEPSTVDPLPSTVHPLQADLTAALTAALQPVLARLEALETGLARPPHDDRPPWTVDGPPSHRPPSTLHPDTWELKPLKHSVRWTVYVPHAMKDELQRRAAARGQNPSPLLQEALARWLAEEG